MAEFRRCFRSSSTPGRSIVVVSSDADDAKSLEASGIDSDPIDSNAIEAAELAAERRTSSIEAGRRKGGLAGAAMAGAMLAISEIYEGPQRDEIVAVSESPDEPTDIDKDGIRVDVGDVSVEAKLPDAPDSSNGV